MIQKNSGLFYIPRKSWIHYGLVLTLIILTLGTNFAIAQDKNVKQKGKNIIRDKRSSSYIPIPQDEFDSMNERVNQEGITDEEIKAIEARAMEISKELKNLYKETHNEEKQKMIKIKRDLVTSILSNETINSDAAAQLRDIPIISITSDSEYDAIEFIIKAEEFTEENIEKYIKTIRNIVGDEIDISLSPGKMPQFSLCFNRTANCNPVKAGVVIITPLAPCTAGFRATYDGDDGFVTAGHCVDDIVGAQVFLINAFGGLIKQNSFVIPECFYRESRFIYTRLDSRLMHAGMTIRTTYNVSYIS